MVEAIAPLLAACPHLDASWQSICQAATYVRPGDETAARSFVEHHFQAVALGDNLFTGYFELDVKGSRVRGGPYQIPLLRSPRNPRQFDRASIEHGALAGQGLELLWLTSAADLYFLQLQGSGRVHLPDGAVVRVGYDTANGRTPTPTDALFRQAGLDGTDLSIPGMRSWIAAHPRRGYALLSHDPSFVFFHEDPNPPQIGHIGALGAPLVALRSVAVDPQFVPLGSPVWVDTTDSFTGAPLRRLMLAGDTGDTIHGPSHTDIFYGAGRHAELQGGHMHAVGREWVLEPIKSDLFASLPSAPLE
jgi:membrane-bound lytic murein transglycosylase A